MATEKIFEPTHPGEILLEDWMKPFGISVNFLAHALGVDTMRISRIVNGKIGISADTALRLSRFYGSTAEFWMNLQSLYDLRMAKLAAEDEIKKIKKPNLDAMAARVGQTTHQASRKPAAKVAARGPLKERSRREKLAGTPR